MSNTVDNTAYVVLFQYSPNGRRDRGETCASVSDDLLFSTREAACNYVKAKYDELLEQERNKGSELDKDWGIQFSDEDMKAIGYSWNDDFSHLGFEYESKYEDVQPEPKYSWTVVELTPAH